MMRRGTQVLPGNHTSRNERYAYLADGFDRLAATYDDDVGGNAIGVRMRQVFRKSLASVFPRSGRLFEIGCGTGTDALWLASRGFEVVATDISEGMVEQVRDKAKAEGLSERVVARKLSARDVGQLADEFGAESFEGGYCHAGALNMEPEVAGVPASVRELTRAGGHFVCSVINKTSLFEVLFYPAVLRPRKAFRRLGNVVPIPISRKPPFNGYVVPTRFYSPAEMVRLFHESFVLEHLRGLRVLLPPANLTDEYARLLPLFMPLERIEEQFASLPLVRSWGHHSLMTFRRI